MADVSISIPDFHSHLLPSVDDGSTGVAMTLEMLARMAEQGIDRVVATPHFYPTKQAIHDFLDKRAQAIRSLSPVYCSGQHPRLYLGAEVAYFHGISRSDSLEKLCIEGTDLLLVEMPFSRWTSEQIEEILEIQESQNLQPILAHIERYLSHQKRSTLATLLQNGVWIQSNAAFFLDPKTEKAAEKMLRRGAIHLLGSDCHNLTTRKPNLGTAVQKLTRHKLFGELRLLQETGEDLLSTATAVLS